MTLLDKYIDFEIFEPQQFFDAGETIVVRGHTKATIKTGGGFDRPWVHIFSMNGGKVARFEEFYDSGQIEAALQTRAKAG